MGWGEKSKDTHWQVEVNVSNGKIQTVEPHFRGYEGKGFPEEDAFADSTIQFLPPGRINLSTHTHPNPSPNNPATEGVVIELEGNQGTMVEVRINDKTYQHNLNELIDGARTHYLGGFVSPAICFHQAVPQSEYQLQFDLKHQTPSKTRDWYYIRVHQENGQMAWSSPIWVEGSS